MRSCVWVLFTAVVVAVLSCRHDPEIEQRAPLLPGKPSEAQPAPHLSEGPPADNSRCHVCHMNYEDEELALSHARGGIGCEECHGDSTRHCSDEDNITPPDILYPRAKINPSCLNCHPKDKLSEVHKPIIAGTSEEKYCTDCHGAHRLAYRTRQWDKATGKLVSDDGVRMMRDEPVRQK